MHGSNLSPDMTHPSMVVQCLVGFGWRTATDRVLLSVVVLLNEGEKQTLILSAFTIAWSLVMPNICFLHKTHTTKSLITVMSQQFCWALCVFFLQNSPFCSMKHCVQKELAEGEILLTFSLSMPHQCATKIPMVTTSLRARLPQWHSGKLSMIDDPSNVFSSPFNHVPLFSCVCAVHLCTFPVLFVVFVIPSEWSWEHSMSWQLWTCFRWQGLCSACPICPQLCALLAHSSSWDEFPHNWEHRAQALCGFQCGTGKNCATFACGRQIELPFKFWRSSARSFTGCSNLLLLCLI